MGYKQMVPLIIYDNRCYLCIRFARIVEELGRGRLTLVGHYSKTGEDLREAILDSSALEMFWFVDGETAFGGRAALLPLLKAIIFAKKDGRKAAEPDESCETGCKNARAVILRSASLLTRSRTIKITEQV